MPWKPTSGFQKGMSAYNKGKKFPADKFPNYGMRGKKMNVETKMRMSISAQGKKMSKNSKIKMSLTKLKELNPNWKYGRTILGNGYIYILSPEHPLSINRNKKGRGARGYVAEHRLVMEKFLGRYLDKKEYVHHRNGIKDDNRIENLELILKGKTHKGDVVCPFCNKQFSIQ